MMIFRKFEYNRSQNKQKKLISVEFMMQISIKFDAYTEYFEEISDEDNVHTIRMNQRYIPEISYGFIIPVKLNSQEYLENRFNDNSLTNLLFKKVENSIDYYKNTREILQKETPGRMFTISISKYIASFEYPKYNYEEEE